MNMAGMKLDFSDGVVNELALFVAADIASNNTIYRHFDEQFQPSLKDYKKMLKKKKSLYEHTMLFKNLPADRALKTYKVYCKIVLMGRDTDPLIEFLNRQYPGYSRLIAEHRNHHGQIRYLDIIKIAKTKGDATKAVMTFCTISMMLMAAPDVDFCTDETDIVKDTMSYIINFTKIRRTDRSGKHINRVEKYYYDYFKRQGSVREFLFEDDISFITAAILPLGGESGIIDYEFTDEDCRVLSEAAYAATMATMEDRGLLPKPGQDMPKEDPLLNPQNMSHEYVSRLEMNDKDIPDVDYGYMVLAYVMAKNRNKDRVRQLEIYIDSIDTSSKDDFVPRTTYHEAERKIDQLRSLVDGKQDELNRMQLQMDKLQEKLDKARNELDETRAQEKEFQSVVDSYDDEESTVNSLLATKPELPGNAILFGGHPNWQKKVREQYPDLRIIDADNNTFSVDIVRNAGLVLMNVLHMSHRQYFKIIRAIRQYDIPFQYIR